MEFWPEPQLSLAWARVRGAQKEATGAQNDQKVRKSVPNLASLGESFQDFS